MPEIRCLNGSSDCFELGFVEREATPKPLMKLSIQLHATGRSLSDTISVLESFGVSRARSTVHNWVRKADLEPEGGKSPDHAPVDRDVIWLNDQQYWLHAAVDPATNGFLHVSVFHGCIAAFAEIFLDELFEKHDVEDALYLVDGGSWLHAALHRYGLDFEWVTHGRRNAVERIFKDVKRRTCQFANHFRHASVESSESWLETLAFAWNQLI